MTSATATRRGQRHAESLMTLTVEAFARIGSSAVKPGDLRADDRYVSQGTSVAKVQSPAQPAGRTETVGNVERVVIESGLHLPIDSYLTEAGLAIRPGWRFTVTAVGRADDPALLGVTYEVVKIGKKSRATARRMDVVEV